MKESDSTKIFPLSGALKDLYESYPDDEKMDFVVAYLYLKYTSTFLHRTADKFGFATTKSPPEPLDPGLEIFIHSYLDTMLRKAGSVKTMRFRKCSQEEAVEIMHRSHDAGAVQMAFWKKELNRNFGSGRSMGNQGATPVVNECQAHTATRR